MRNNGQLIMNVFVEGYKISWFQLPCQHPAQITFVCAEKPVSIAFYLMPASSFWVCPYCLLLLYCISQTRYPTLLYKRSMQPFLWKFATTTCRLSRHFGIESLRKSKLWLIFRFWLVTGLMSKMCSDLQTQWRADGQKKLMICYCTVVPWMRAALQRRELRATKTTW